MKFLTAVLALLVALTLTPQTTLGAAILLESDQPEIIQNSTFRVNVLLDPEDETLNVVQGIITFPAKTLELIGINDGGSVVNFWIDRPKPEEPCPEVCNISFSGVIPGGFEGVLGSLYRGGRPGKVLELIFRAKASDVGTIYVEEGITLLHDGRGTPADTKLGALGFEILPAKTSGETELGALFAGDKTSPEPFTPEFVRDQALFNNRWALVFFAQDKESGIAYYEIKEGRRAFERAESPYLLKNQLRYDEIFVRAYDRAGNVREVTLAPQRERPFWAGALFWLILLATLAILARVLPRLWKGFYAQGER